MHQQKHIDWLGRWKHVHEHISTYRITPLDNPPPPPYYVYLFIL